MLSLCNTETQTNITLRYITFVLCVKIFLYEKAFISDRFANFTEL